MRKLVYAGRTREGEGGGYGWNGIKRVCVWGLDRLPRGFWEKPSNINGTGKVGFSPPATIGPQLWKMV